ncbi:MAG: helix-turn-helix domain-containing protein [Candidatus Ratteibacteria bacterium]
MAKEKEMLSNREVCSMLGVSRTTLYYWAQKGLIHFLYTPGGQKRYYRAEIEKLMNDQNPKKDHKFEK